MQELCLGGMSFKLTDKLINEEHFPVLKSLQLKGTSQNIMDIDDGTMSNIKVMSATSLRELEFHFCQ